MNLEKLLTRQQFAILRMVATGYSNSEIARKLVIELRTVERHISDIREKLGLTEASSGRVLMANSYWRYSGEVPYVPERMT